MTVPRYLLVAGPPGEAQAEMRRRAGDLAGALGFAPWTETGLLLALGAGDAPIRLDERGLIIGTLYPRTPGAARVRHLEGNAAVAVAASGGATLMDGHWGTYVAVLTDPRRNEVQLVRPPFGELGCYYSVVGGTLVASSEARLLTTNLGTPPAIDWGQVARHLLAPELRPAATCLAGITELLGGDSLAVGPEGVARRTLWSPWRHLQHAPAGGGDIDTIAGRLRDVVLDTVGRWAAGFRHVLVGLSGGLDSSIVAASVHAAGVPLSGVTFVTDDPLGDERAFARLVAAHCRARLAERYREIAGIDLARSNAAHLPRPVGRSFAQESERIGLEVAAQVGADAIFRGGGGDNVFCYLQSVAPLADRLLIDGPGLAALQTALDICRLTGCSLMTALRRGAERAWRRPAAYRWAADISLLPDEVAQGAAEAVRHPWLEPPPGTLPGQAAHVALVLGMANHMEPLAPGHRMPLLSPLMAQPIVELCLGVPSWLWCRGGHNRAVARRAFAAHLPPAILNRRGKGTPEAFVIEIYEANRAWLLDRLAHGHLARERLIDVDAVARIIGDPRPVTGHGFSRVVQLADIEAWIDSWTA